MNCKLLFTCGAIVFAAATVYIVRKNARALKNIDQMKHILAHAQDTLNVRYDYHKAIQEFKDVIALYEKECGHQKTDALCKNSSSLAAQAYISLAFAYHHIGSHKEREIFMEKGRELLAIPLELKDYKLALFKPEASAYFIVEGYRWYIKYENLSIKKEPIKLQEDCLFQAKAAFEKALEISCAFPTVTIAESAHAYHGLGTILEFLGKCKQEQGSIQGAQDYFSQSVQSFERALEIRQKTLGLSHPHTARSHHKVARNYVLLGDVLNKNDQSSQAKNYYQKADASYQEAIAIFEKNNIAKEQAKRKELEDEYNRFKNR